MQVKAMRLGYYKHLRRREGSVFEMDQKDYMELDAKGKPVEIDGKPKIICSWVKPLSAVNSRGKVKVEAVEPDTENLDVL